MSRQRRAARSRSAFDSQRGRAPSRRQSYRRRLRIEPLEDRRLLSITVTTLVDENNGIGAGAGTSLREAIFATLAGDSIDFSVTGTINLTNLGHLVINKNLTINGPGAGLLTINAFDPTPDTNNGNGSRVFQIDDGNNGTLIDVEITGLTLTGGDVTGLGGAIFCSENLSINESIVTGNAMVASGQSNQNGGGIYHLFGTLALTDCTISNNVAGFQGGGIFSNLGSMTITRCTISGNSIIGLGAAGGGLWCSSATVTQSTISGNSAATGGGIFTAGQLTVVESTISGNSGADGGGISQSQGDLTISSSTLSGNMVGRNGGGIRSVSGSLTVRHSTISGNAADTAIGGYTGRGGGVWVGSSTAILDHTIVAANIRQTATRDDLFGAATARYCLMGDSTGATITSSGLNLVGMAGSPIDPLLSPLVDNGGPTKTHALMPGSLAIDRGDPAAAAGAGSVPLYDQRGTPIDRIFDGNGAGGRASTSARLNCTPWGRRCWAITTRTPSLTEPTTRSGATCSAKPASRPTVAPTATATARLIPTITTSGKIISATCCRRQAPAVSPRRRPRQAILPCPPRPRQQVLRLRWSGPQRSIWRSWTGRGPRRWSNPPSVVTMVRRTCRLPSAGRKHLTGCCCSRHGNTASRLGGIYRKSASVRSVARPVS